MTLIYRRIKDITDIIDIYNGITDGIKNEQFSERKLMEIISLIASENHTFYMFLDRNKEIRHSFDVVLGFGCLTDNGQIQKIYVFPSTRRRGIGIRISLKLAWIVTQYKEHLPTIVIKNSIRYWQRKHEDIGYKEVEHSYFTEEKKYVLRDFDKFVKACKKYKIDKIKKVE